MSYLNTTIQPDNRFKNRRHLKNEMNKMTTRDFQKASGYPDFMCNDFCENEENEEDVDYFIRKHMSEAIVVVKSK